VPERSGGEQVLKRVKQMGDKVSRLATIWTDGGNDCPAFMMWVMDVCRWIVQVVLRPEHYLRVYLAQKAPLLWNALTRKLMGCRRLVRDYELLPETSETFIYLAMIRIMVRRLA